MGRPKVDPLERFEQKFTKLSGNRCWIWNAGKDWNGYGAFQLSEKKTVKAHRFSYETYVGKIPDEWCVCHHCDNPPCVNPKHLFMGTHKDNIADMDKKGRRNLERDSYNVGDAHPRKKLKSEDVLVIKKLIKDGVPKKEIALKYGVSASTIFDISLGRSWATLGT